jgi:hypothetical protein
MTERYYGQEPERIALWYVPMRTPAGGAPEMVREQWRGIPLPVRQHNVINETNTVYGFQLGADISDPTNVHLNEPLEIVTVNTADAFKALRIAGRETAATWWESWFQTRNSMFGSTLLFQASEGRIYSPEEIEKEIPGTGQFDEIEI